ncbi:MAG: TetR family transcriptional regulator [Bacteroidota bacterium]
MSTKSIKSKNDFSTEEKIKNAARIVFHKKGFAATRTRDISEESGINLALLNYYFRSKENLFNIIMLESLQGFFQSMSSAFNDETSSLENKIEILVNNYIDLLIENPDIPIFILSELRTNPKELISKIDIKKVLLKSYFFKQFQSYVKAGKITPIHPMHIMMNLAGMIVFPFIMSPGLKEIGGIKQDEFNKLMLQRKAMIPKWIQAIIKVK